jgi:hypothetical protein
MALRTGRTGPTQKTELSQLRRIRTEAENGEDLSGGSSLLSCRDELSTQNWSGQGESDSLIKTKHCDGPKG